MSFSFPYFYLLYNSASFLQAPDDPSLYKAASGRFRDIYFSPHDDNVDIPAHKVRKRERRAERLKLRQKDSTSTPAPDESSQKRKLTELDDQKSNQHCSSSP